MAKKSVINRNLKRFATVKKYKSRRIALKEIIKSKKSSAEECFQAVIKLQSMPRNASPCRIRNRCGLSGSPHGFYRKFGLSKTKFRERIMNGEVPGLSKASW